MAFYAYTSAGRAFRRLLGVEIRATCVILYYHAVAAKHRQDFGRQMDTVLRLTKTINLDAVPTLTPETRYSAITFDDGFEDALDNAVPELVQRNIPATFFVTAGVMGETAGWWPVGFRERQEKIAPLERFLQLPSDVISIGAHTMTHPKLTLLNEADARREIYESRIRLEELFHRKVPTFSFPFGAFNEDLIEWCREAGYSRVFTTQPMSAFKSSDEFATGRVVAEPTDWPLEFSLKLLGAYCWVPHAILLKKKFMSNALVKKVRSTQVSHIGHTTT